MWQEFDEANIQSDIIIQRQEDINQIERLIVEIDGMTKDMAMEVIKADESLAVIVENTENTKKNTKQAANEIAKGAEYQKASQKKA